jgi:predicted transcriptional regulator
MISDFWLKLAFFWEYSLLPLFFRFNAKLNKNLAINEQNCSRRAISSVFLLHSYVLFFKVRLKYCPLMICERVLLSYLVPLKSELKVAILISLLDGNKNLSELKTVVGARETTILHILKEFENLALTTKSHGIYGLTSLGIVEASICRECSSAAAVVGDFKEFWLCHDISSLPVCFLLRLGELKDSFLVKAESSDLGKVHETFMQVLLSAKKIQGVSPIFHPDYVSAFRQLLNKGNPVDLVLTNSVLEKTLGSADAKLLHKYILDERLRIFVKDDLKVALTITENSFSLGLFGLDGNYDYGMDLVSLSPRAVAWGEELFRNMLAKSQRFMPGNPIVRR